MTEDRNRIAQIEGSVCVYIPVLPRASLALTGIDPIRDPDRVQRRRERDPHRGQENMELLHAAKEHRQLLSITLACI